MAESNFRGPLYSMGSLEIQGGSAATIEPMDGPSLLYQDSAIPDIRAGTSNKDGTAPARVVAFAAGANLWACDGVPQGTSSTTLAAAQAMTATVAVSLVTAQPAGIASSNFVAVGVPIIPVGTTVATVAALAIDFGFTTGTTATNSTTVVVVDNALFHLGQWLVIAGAGNSTASRSLITQVASISGANLTTIYISPAAATVLLNVPIGQGNLFGSGLLPPATQFGPAAASANAHSFGGAFAAGLARVVNPRETLARTIVMQGATSITSYSAIVSGWDVWGNPMTELISFSSSTTVSGKKAFKYIGSITSGTTSAPTGDQIAVGLGDTFGLPFRADEWEQTDIFWKATAATNSNGFTACALGTSTSTTGDVRGTIQLSTAWMTGTLTTSVIGAAGTTNSTSRFAVVQNIGVWNQMYGTPINTIPMFGWAQSTAVT